MPVIPQFTQKIVKKKPAKHKTHTHSDQADLMRGLGGLKSKLGLKTERWLIHQEQVDQALVPLGLGPGLITVLFLDVSIA